jgi:hypothetical protein
MGPFVPPREECTVTGVLVVSAAGVAAPMLLLLLLFLECFRMREHGRKWRRPIFVVDENIDMDDEESVDIGI